MGVKEVTPKMLKENKAFKEEFNLSEKIDTDRVASKKGAHIIRNYDVLPIHNVKEFIRRREARLRNQIRIHWKWLKKRPSREVADFIVNVANAEAGEHFK